MCKMCRPIGDLNRQGLTQEKEAPGFMMDSTEDVRFSGSRRKVMDYLYCNGYNICSVRTPSTNGKLPPLHHSSIDSLQRGSTANITTMPTDAKEAEAEDPPSPEVPADSAPEGAMRTPHGSALSVKSDGAGGEADTLEARSGRLMQVTAAPHSRESSVPPIDVSSYRDGMGPTSHMAASSLQGVNGGTTSPMVTNRRKRSKGCSECCTCTGCGPQDGGRVLSIAYCVVVSILATVLPIREGLQNSWLTDIPSAVFLGYLYGISILFVIFVEIHLLRRAKRRRKRRKNQRRKQEADDISLQEGAKSVDSAGKSNLAYTSQNTLVVTAPNGKPVDMDDYDDSKSVKSEMSTMTELFMGDSDPDLDQPLPHRISLFHRIALSVFALGFMIYLGLLLKQLHERHSPAACSSSSAVWPHYVHLAFLLLQTFFIFKHAQVPLHSWQPIFRLGFMHLVVTNWSVIVRALIRETLEAYLKYTVDIKKKSQNVTSTSIPTNVDTSPYDQCYADEDILYRASPFLYPFVLQYSLLAIAAAYSLYADVGATPTLTEEPEIKEPPEVERSEAELRRMRRLSSHYSQAPPAINFHKTHQGLFFGLVILAGTIVSIILFFSYLGGDDIGGHALSVLIYYSSDLALQAVLALVVWIGWVRVRKLTWIKLAPGVSGVDETLILVALMGSVLYRLFRILSIFSPISTGAVPSINVILTFTDLIVGIGLNLFQAGFVIDCFSRRSTSRRHLKLKPGRGSITFLLVANLALWAFRMFQFRQLQVSDTITPASERLEYGYVFWTFVELACIPLSIYYHYQVSASLARAWNNSYNKETVRETLLKKEEAEVMLKHNRSMDLGSGGYFPRPSPIMRMIELRRRFRHSFRALTNRYNKSRGNNNDARGHQVDEEPEVESETVWSPVSDV